jgi:hypothetical protein
MRRTTIRAEKEVDTIPMALGFKVRGGREWWAAAVDAGHGSSSL